MVFKLQEFISSIQNEGIARTNYFEVIITPPEFLTKAALSIATQRLITLRCQSIQLPEVDFQVLPYNQKVVGPGEQRVTGINPYKTIPMSFIVDKDLKIRQFFENWMQYIVNYGDFNNYAAIQGNQLPYEISYKNEYTATIEIKVYPSGLSSDGITNDNSSVKIYRLYNAYPVNMGNVSLNWNGEDNMILPMGFNYDRIQMPIMLQYTNLSSSPPSVR